MDDLVTETEGNCTWKHILKNLIVVCNEENDEQEEESN